MTRPRLRSTRRMGCCVTVGAICALLLALPTPAAAQFFDPSFNATTNGAVHAIAVQADGKVIIGGAFTQVNAVTHGHLARLNADGSLDAAFTTGVTVGANVWAVAVTSDGHILVGGDFTQLGGVAKTRIARLMPDGSIDPAFTTTANFTVDVMLVQPDGKILVGGGFSQINGTARNGLARLNADGTLDGAFAPSFNNSVFALALQADGAIVVGGIFGTVNGISRIYLARLNGGGSLDTNFSPLAINRGGANFVNAVAVKADGHILVGGRMTFQAPSAETRDFLAQLDGTDGSLDLSFNVPVVGGNLIDSVVPLADGRFLIGGNFNNVDGINTYAAARLFPNGAFDSSFDTAGGGTTTNLVETMVVQPDQKVMVGGTLGLTNIARLLPNGPFTDQTLTSGLTVIKAVHITELRQRVDAARLGKGLTVFPWTDPTLTPGVTVVKALHIEELRTALADAYIAGGAAPPIYTDPMLSGGATVVQAAHIVELRNALLVIETTALQVPQGLQDQR
ncbi:MAG TPA: delta-60 repeat domain-containing protein [Vicinamibacterales bacterium]|nr:delta-60 repeat domain-containing protein [Vicinamibacterales bacterium]